ncbi:MAG: universal stress protein [Ignavibacteria bacterium]|nr:universal stress protein [Ignavibacteria bacterium]
MTSKKQTQILVQIKKPKVLERILVPTDLSQLSLVALEYANSIAETYDAKVFLVYVCENVPSPKKQKKYPQLTENIKELKKKIKEELKDIAIEKLNLAEEVEIVLLDGNPYKEILRFAVENQVGLIVVASHGRTGFSHLLMGSVAEKIVRYSPIPVLTVKPSEFSTSFLTREDVEKELHLKYKPDDFFEF